MTSWKGPHKDEHGRLLPEFIEAMKQDVVIAAEWELKTFGVCSSAVCKRLFVEVLQLRSRIPVGVK